MLKAVIIDDEKDSREILAAYLKKYCQDVTIVGFGESVSTGLDSIHTHKPDVVFLDIEMPYGNGFDLLDKAAPVDFETVFVTAFDNYAIRALNQSAAYYLLKPIDIDELVNAVDKIRKEREDTARPTRASLLQQNLKATTPQHQKIMLPTMEGFEIVPVSTIMYCEAVDNFTKFHFETQHPLLICRTLKFFEDVLREHGFLRTHRSFLVNPAFVIRYSKGKGGFITMKNNKELEVSATRKNEFLEYFGKI
jgi:two-component system, LytTR family, response regulator